MVGAKLQDCVLVKVLTNQPNTTLERYVICGTQQYVPVEHLNEDNGLKDVLTLILNFFKNFKTFLVIFRWKLVR
jgi:hypothetical protein